MVHLTITPTGVNLSPGGEVILRRQTWADYEHLLECRGENAAVKVSYNARSQEIRMMAPLPRRKSLGSPLQFRPSPSSDQCEVWQEFDPITLKRFGEAGLEPDGCFYIANCTAILGKDRIDIGDDPPPDLAIEIDATSSTRAEDYEPLGIPELWIYRDDALHVYLFDGRHYRETTESHTFPEIAVCELLPPYVRRAWEAGLGVALREFEAALAKEQA